MAPHAPHGLAKALADLRQTLESFPHADITMLIEKLEKGSDSHRWLLKREMEDDASSGGEA